MRKLTKFTLALVLSMFMGGNAWSLTITDVGGLDTFLASSDLGNSGDAAEELWIESVLGFDVSLDGKYDSEGSDWTLADGETDVYYLDMMYDPEYFMLKIGTGGTSLVSHYLFQNIGDLNYAVVDFSAAGIDFSIKNIGIDRMSHVGEVNGTVVSEPATLALFGLGLMGIVLTRRQLAS